jgi:hypothetical protein
MSKKMMEAEKKGMEMKPDMAKPAAGAPAGTPPKGSK